MYTHKELSHGNDQSFQKRQLERIGDEIRIRPARRRLDRVLSKFSQFSAEFMEQGRGDNQEAERDPV
jgi:antitoxin VapB